MAYDYLLCAGEHRHGDGQCFAFRPGQCIVPEHAHTEKCWRSEGDHLMPRLPLDGSEWLRRRVYVTRRGQG